MTFSTHKLLLQNFGQSLELELEFDDNNQCLLMTDDQLFISIRSLDDAWIFYGMVGGLETAPDDKASAERAEEATNIPLKLLARNMTLAEAGTASIVLEKSSGVIMLVQRVTTLDIDGERMKEVLDNFVTELGNTVAIFQGQDEEQLLSLPPSASARMFMSAPAMQQ